MDEVTAGRPTGPGSVHPLPLAIAAVLGIAGARLVLLGGRTAITGGVLLMVGALIAAGVAVGSAPDPARAPDGSADLSSRLGLGLLGGILAGLLHALLTVTAGWLGITALLGAGVDVQLSGLDWWNRVMIGAALGVALGAVYPLLPRGTFIAKGTTFGLLVAAWQLFYAYPFRLGLGLGGIDAGWSVPVLVAVGAVVAGMIAAWVVSWGGAEHDEPLSAPLVA